MDYRRMSRPDKQRYHREQSKLAEPVECGWCQVKVMATQIEQHRERCVGRPLSRPWLRWRELRELGVANGSLMRWVGRGLVRRRKQEDGQWAYSQVDVRRAMDMTLRWHQRRHASARA